MAAPRHATPRVTVFNQKFLVALITCSFLFNYLVSINLIPILLNINSILVNNLYHFLVN